MPVAVSYPGVYVEEIPSGVHTITGVSTSVTAFIGTAEMGEVNVATMLTSFADYQRSFGGFGAIGRDPSNPTLAVTYPMAYAVRDFFQNGGSTAIAIRIHKSASSTGGGSGASADAATATLGSGLTLVADSPGAWGNEFIVACEQIPPVDTSDPTKVNFNLRIYRTNPDDPQQPNLVEMFANVNTRVGDNGYVKDVLESNSSYLSATTATSPPANMPTADADLQKLLGQVIFQGQLPALPKTTLAADIDATATSITVASSTGFPTATPFTALVESEQVQVTTVSGATWTVTRGSGGTTAAAHKSGAPVTQPPSAASPKTKLAADINAAATSLTVASSATVPPPPFNAGIDSETVAVTAVSGTTWTITRAASGSTAATHAKDAVITVQLPTAPTAVQQLSGGQDSAASLAATDFVGDEASKTGLYALDKIDLFNLLCIPLDDGTGNDALASQVYQGVLQYCVKRRAFLIVDPPTSWETGDPESGHGTMLSGLRNNPRSQKSQDLPLSGTFARNAAVFYPRILQVDPVDGVTKRFAPCGVIAGVFANTDATRGVWKAPAGTDAALVGVSKLTVKLTDAENGFLNPVAINCLRSFPAFGNVVWGSRTLRGDDLQADDYKYIPVRRLALYIEESLYRGTQWAVFEPNDEPLWAQLRLNIGVFMHDLFRQGAFQGSTPKDAYFVKCDKETTTQSDINRGVVNVVVGFAPLKPAEFIILQLQQMAGQLDV